MRRSLLLPPLCAALLAGCGGDDGEDEESRSPATLRPGQTLRVAGDEYSFDPSRVVVTRAPAGRATALRIRLVNEGALAHNLRVLRGDRELGGTPTFPGGEARSGTVRLPPGRYRMVCTVGDHEQLGMVGRLDVRAR